MSSMGASELPKPGFREALFPINFAFVDHFYGSNFIILTEKVILSKLEPKSKRLRQQANQPGSRLVGS